MKATEEQREFKTGSYICPHTKEQVSLQRDLPRAWVQWPVHVQCKSCGREHVLQYEDVVQDAPLFGHE